MRTFIGLSISQHLCEQAECAAKQLQEVDSRIRTVTPDDFHITLKFLGETNVNRLPFVKDLLVGLADSVSSFKWTARGVGVFPDERRPAVVWMGIDDLGAMSRLASTLDAELLPLGFPKEHRPFHPHLTLARINRRPSPLLLDWLDQNRDRDFGTEVATEIHLYQSEPNQHGPRYKRLCSVPLK